MSQRVPPPELFIDRSLGREHLPEALRACGLAVHTLSSVYGEEEGQHVSDVRWLADAGRHEWIVLMKDDAIRRRPAERDALTEARVRAFCLTNAQLRAAEQTARFVENRPASSRPRGSPARTSTACTRAGSSGSGRRRSPKGALAGFAPSSRYAVRRPFFSSQRAACLHLPYGVSQPCAVNRQRHFSMLSGGTLPHYEEVSRHDHFDDVRDRRRG